jgi:hypothetical protein
MTLLNAYKMTQAKMPNEQLTKLLDIPAPLINIPAEYRVS